MVDLAFACAVALLRDADSFRCADGRELRLAGIEANERRGGCHTRVCPRVGYVEAGAIARRMLLGRTLACTAHDRDRWGRTVASCRLAGRDVGCTLVARGLAVEWLKYRARYRLRACTPFSFNQPAKENHHG